MKPSRSALFTVIAICFGLVMFAAMACTQKPVESPPPPGPGPQVQPATTAAQAPQGGTTTASAPSPGAKKKLRFLFVPKALHIPVFEYARKGAEREAKVLGNVEIIWNGPSSDDQMKQKEIIETGIATGVDGMAISCLNGDFLTPVIDEAMAKGIPVVTWDSDAPKSKRVAFYGVNDYESGVIMGQEIVKLMGPQGGEMAAITTLGADNLSRRLEGAMSVIRQQPQIKLVETFDVSDDTIITGRVVATATERYPNLRAWLSVGGWPGFARNILDPVNPKKTFVVCFDTIPPAPEIIKEGKMQLAVGQKYFGWGSEPTKILYDIVVNKKYPPNPVIDSGVDVVNAQNVDQYLLKWKKMEAGEIVE